MLKKTIKYTDYFGEEREEDFYFNLNKAELSEMELSVDGGYTNMLDRIVKAKNAPELISAFKSIIMRSYGEKSSDGRRFVKSKELSEAFCQTEAYNVLFMELISDEKAMANFVNGIIPDDLRNNGKPALPESVMSGKQ